MARAIGNFSEANPGESELYAFDFVNDLQPGDSVNASIPAVWEVIATNAGDDDPNARLIGDPTISGTKTTQRMSNPVANVEYAVSATVKTTLGNAITLWAPWPGEPIGC